MNKKLATTLAYVAGIVDGEGCIGINRCHVRGRKGEKYEHYMLRVEVANTSRELVVFLHETFGGQFYTGKRPNRKAYYRWTLAAKQAEAFLRLVYPYLFVKKAQADLVFEFRRTTTSGGTLLNSDTVAFRKHCYDAMGALKQAEYA